MLSRYRIHRGRRPPGDPAPEGARQDTRKHTAHCLRPAADRVAAYLRRPSAAAWRDFAAAYRELLAERFAADRDPFDRLAAMAAEGDVWLGCSCPTAANPDVRRCHTWLALEFMQRRYPDLEVVFPASAAPTSSSRRRRSSSGSG